jgi:hypothetical protein
MPRPPLDGRGGVSRQSYLAVVEVAVDFFFFFLLLLCFFDECLDELDDLLEAAGATAAGAAAAGAAAGVSAAIAPAVIPKANKAEAIKVPDLCMGSPTVV